MSRTKESYLRYWDERNGGNVSVRLEASEVEGYEDVKEVKRVLDLGFDASTPAGYYYLGNWDRPLLQKRDKTNQF